MRSPVLALCTAICPLPAGRPWVARAANQDATLTVKIAWPASHADLTCTSPAAPRGANTVTGDSPGPG